MLASGLVLFLLERGVFDVCTTMLTPVLGLEKVLARTP